jgi:hypothetical protein
MTVLMAIWAVLKASRPLQAAVALLAAWVGFQTWLMVRDAGVRKETRTTINRTNVDTARKAEAARAAARQPGSADRLRARYCEGC